MAREVCRAWTLVCLVFPVHASIPSLCSAQEADPVATEITAAYLYSLAKFADWPADTWVSEDSPFVLGVVGREESARALAASLCGRTVRGRPVALWYLDEFEDLEKCQLLWIDSVTAKRWSELLTRLSGRPVLTVGRGLGFARDGGMVGLFAESDRIRFAVNRRAVAQSRLSLSAKLLRLAVLLDGEASR